MPRAHIHTRCRYARAGGREQDRASAEGRAGGEEGRGGLVSPVVFFLLATELRKVLLVLNQRQHGFGAHAHIDACTQYAVSAEERGEVRESRPGPAEILDRHLRLRPAPGLCTQRK